MRTILALVRARLHGRPLELEGPTGRFNLFPDGTLLPVICGASHIVDPDPVDPPENDPEPPDDPEVDPSDADPDDDPEPTPQAPEEPFDKERAMRTIKRQREVEEKERRRRQQAEAERDELRRAQETEQERLVRETGEAKEAAARERARADNVAIDLALRDAATEEGVPGKKLRRVVRMVERQGLSVDEDGNVEGAEDAVADLLDEFPEFRDEPATPAPDDDDQDAPRRKPGANPDRKQNRGGGELTAKQAARLARDDPDRFMQLMEEGRIGSDQMGGKELSRLRSEGKISSRSADAEDGVTPRPHVRG